MAIEIKIFEFSDVTVSALICQGHDFRFRLLDGGEWSEVGFANIEECVAAARDAAMLGVVVTLARHLAAGKLRFVDDDFHGDGGWA